MHQEIFCLIQPFLNLSFLMPIYISYRQNDMMDYIMQGRQQEWWEQPVQDRSRENTWLWLRVPL